MENKIYLLSISVSGIKNIKDEVCLNFYKKNIDKNFNPEKYRIKAIYGENGSGKSALITAVKIFQDVIFSDNYLNESKTQIFLDEIINKQTCLFRFSCEFLLDEDAIKTIYKYSIHIGRGKSGLFEILYEDFQMKNGNYPNNTYKTIYKCENGRLIYVNCNGTAKDNLEKRTTNLLSTHAFIYLYIINLDEESLFEKSLLDSELFIHLIAFIIFLLLLTVYLGEEDQHNLYFLHKRFRENDSSQQTIINEFLDQEIHKDIFPNINEKMINKEYFEAYKAKVERLTQFIKIFKPNLISIDIDAKEHRDQYACELNLNYGDYVINKEFESTGIKKLIGLFDCFVSASEGGIVFVDEMDSNLNDIYLCKLIEYFMYYGKGQLCFTTHNLDPMSILKKNRNSIDFLSSDNHLVSWTSRGNATPENCYKNGMIEDSPFNVEATDFVGILGE